MFGRNIQCYLLAESVVLVRLQTRVRAAWLETGFDVVATAGRTLNLLQRARLCLPNKLNAFVGFIAPWSEHLINLPRTD